MVISYDNLWKLLIDKKMNKTDLKDKAGITYNIIARLGKGESVSMESLYKICKCLQCNIGDIMEFKFDGHRLNKMKGAKVHGEKPFV